MDRAYYRAAAQMLVNPVLGTLERSFDAAGSRDHSSLDDRRLYQMMHRRPGCELDEALFASRSVALFPTMTLEGGVREIVTRHLAQLA